MIRKSYHAKAFNSLIVCGLTVMLAACGGGGGGGVTGTTTNGDGEILSSLTTGNSLPEEVSAIPATTSIVSSLSSALKRLAASATDLPANSDYETTVGAKYIEEPTIDQFDIIKQVLGAVKQTHYNDAENINNGQYKSMVAWADKRGGMEIKTLEPWIVDSRMIVVDGQDVNRVLCWIEEPDPTGAGGIRTVKAEMKIYAAASFGTDGKVLDYGHWDLNVAFDDAAESFFVASAEPNPEGGAIIKISQSNDEGGDEPFTMKGVLYRTGTSGYGKVEYTDFESCTDWPCSPDQATARYAYNEDYLAVQKDDDALAYKDRNTTYEMTHRYGLFYDENHANAGDDVLKHKSFGFPVVYTDDEGAKQSAYYGAWQGRHQLWAQEGETIAAGTVVTKEKWGSAGTDEVYTVAPVLNGSFTKRTYVDASLDDIKNVPVETWIHKNYNLFYISDGWYNCADGWIQWGWDEGLQAETQTCMGHDGTEKDMTAYTPNSELIVGAQDRKSVSINRWDNNAQRNIDYVYLDSTNEADHPQASFTTVGFYEAAWGNNGRLTAVQGATAYSPSDGDSLWVNIGGSIYIAYTADFDGPVTTTGWIEKEVAEFDSQNWKPIFGDNDSEFSPNIGREYYMNSNGVNYVVKRKGMTDAAASYEAFLEIQTTANPSNCSASDCTAVIPGAVDYLRTPWDPNLLFALETDGTDDKYLLLTYLTDDPNSADDDIGTVYEQGIWGLQGWSNNGTESTDDDYPIDISGNEVEVDEWGFPAIGETDRPVEFNWEYSGEGGWGQQQYLLDGADNYVILNDPIRLEQMTLTNGAGNPMNLMFQYDGWMHGIPDIHQALQENNWQMTDDLADKIINIPAGTAASDGTNGYYIKPLETSIFLAVIDEPIGAPDVTQADDIDFDTDVPTYTPPEPAFPEMETDLPVKYSEGVLVGDE